MNVNKLVIFGDSISTTNFSGGGYEKGLAEKLGCAVENHAVNAAALTAGYPSSVAYAIAGAKDDASVDCVIIWAGTNDWFYGVTKKGFGRSVQYCMTKAKAKFPNAKIILCDPIWRYSERQDTDEKAIADITPNSVGYTLCDYRDEVMRSGAEHICAMNALLGVNADNHTKYLRDGVHPSRYGYDEIEKILYNFINNL